MKPAVCAESLLECVLAEPLMLVMSAQGQADMEFEETAIVESRGAARAMSSLSTLLSVIAQDNQKFIASVGGGS